jgi:hypothetical protein
MAPPRASNRSGGGIWGFVLVFVCVIVTIDVLYIHQKGFRQTLESHGIGFSPPRPEQRPEKFPPVKNVAENMEDFKAAQEEQMKQAEEKESPDKEPEQKTEDSVHKVAGLSCKNYGGPSDEDAAEMVFWNDIPQDAVFVSPYKRNEAQYLTFEPDEGGWNNIRMSMETAVTMALAMGRTLVMPPEQGMYLLHKNDKNQKNRFTFTDFFHFESVANEHPGLEIISFEEFLNREVMTGHIRDKQTGQPLFPPNNRTDWNGVARQDAKQLDAFSRKLGYSSPWNFDQCMAGFAEKPNDAQGEQRLDKMAINVTAIVQGKRMNEMFINKPVPVDASPVERLMENLAHRNRLCVYTPELQKEKVFHLMGDNASNARLLVHFYAFLFFENWKQDLWTKRFVRDHLRYIDEIQCAAARIVHGMREISKKNGNGGIFDTFHIRRGDFQYKDTRVECDVIFDNTFDVLEANSTIYIATDERNKTFFDRLRKRYKIYFMDDFSDELENVNTNYYGMIDQLVASRGRTFIGTFYSTFTGYINRVRGYHSQKDKAEGWELGIINSYYDIPKHTKYFLREYRPISPAMWAREFPVGWRDLDKGIGEPLSAQS